MEIDGKTYLSREEFFKEKGTPRFEVMPLDVNLARAQFELQKRIRQDLTEKQSSEEGFEMKSPILDYSEKAKRNNPYFGRYRIRTGFVCS